MINRNVVHSLEAVPEISSSDFLSHFSPENRFLGLMLCFLLRLSTSFSSSYSYGVNPARGYTINCWIKIKNLFPRSSSCKTENRNPMTCWEEIVTPCHGRNLGLTSRPSGHICLHGRGAITFLMFILEVFFVKPLDAFPAELTTGTDFVSARSRR